LLLPVQVGLESRFGTAVRVKGNRCQPGRAVAFAAGCAYNSRNPGPAADLPDIAEAFVIRLQPGVGVL
jgi:hypothetical protein